MMPLFEAKMLHLYDTRWATYERDGSVRSMAPEEKSARATPIPRYWVAEAAVEKKLAGRWDRSWALGWRDVCRATDVRTVITTRVPARHGYGHKWLLALPARGGELLQACWSSFVFDYVARQKLGGTSMSFATFSQLPVPDERDFVTAAVSLDRSLEAWVGLRVDRLNGWISEDSERAQVRAELDAFVCHIYRLTREELSHVLDTFPIIKRKDEAAFGSFRTKELIMAAYDALAEAKESGTPYRAPWDREVVSS